MKIMMSGVTNTPTAIGSISRVMFVSFPTLLDEGKNCNLLLDCIIHKRESQSLSSSTHIRVCYRLSQALTDVSLRSELTQESL